MRYYCYSINSSDCLARSGATSSLTPISCSTPSSSNWLARSARTLEAKQADDHDPEWQTVLVPFDIFNTQRAQLSIYFGQSAETSDFIVDCLT